MVNFNLIYAQSDSTKAKAKISFKDQEDGALDLSQFLLDHNGVLPVIAPITEPAVGYGGGGAILYFHKRKKQYKSYVPPDVSGLLGLYTQNKTWGAGAFHAHIFGENRVRTFTVLFKPDIRYKYYGNNSAILEKNPIGINLDSWAFMQKAEVRLGRSKFYAGATYTYFTTDVTFDTLPNKPLINEIIKRLNINSTISAIKPTITYDSRNNAFTPTKGIKSEISANISAKWLGSSDNFSTLNTDFFSYLPVSAKVNSAWRFQGSYLLGDAPFFAYPFISLRGIPAMRYQGDNTMVAESEWSYNVYKRWSLIGFGGGGTAFSGFKDSDKSEWAYTFGTGFRYKIARLLGVNMGTDFAWGNGKDFAFYVVFGSSW
ncbi:BamA/TamA family outer membrane protein [Flavihumibacter fluvii]|uniref:BamA/TamA family outer membrane protein n=1 Tax=Flavihumibacter fluvii TaxID=2838157 RepID=UPI001BDEA2B1|nr:BamA/TamA family outer membrane protein [Flavihumibacter fluvii]ULQ51159.1 BamA/TamA family outer membrane protein [Flavihumibacter fluvii]